MAPCVLPLRDWTASLYNNLYRILACLSAPMSTKFDSDEVFCPLCCEELDLSDRNFLPCPCGYQVCIWCWHHIKDELNGLCPACRSPYSDDPHIFAAVDRSEVIKNEKRRKKAAAAAAGSRSQSQGSHVQLTQQANQQVHHHHRGGSMPPVITPTLGGDAFPALPPGFQQRRRSHFESTARRDLANIRVIQRNLVYVTGLHVSIASEATLRKPEYFGQYGRILKMVLNTSNNPSIPDHRALSASVYTTFQNVDDAFACIHACDGFIFEGRQLKANYGTSKYCNAFVNNKVCNNQDCLYLHSLGNPDDSFVKDEIQTKNLLATPLSPNTLTQARVGCPSGSGKRCANPVFPAPVFVAKGPPSGSRDSTQQSSPQQMPVSSAAAAAHGGGGGGNSGAFHNVSNLPSTAPAQPPGIRVPPPNSATPQIRGGPMKSPVLGSRKALEKSGSHITASNVAWPSLGEATSSSTPTTAPIGGWGGTSSSSIVPPYVAALSAVRKVKGKDNSKREAGGKEYPQRPPGAMDSNAGYLQGQQDGAEQCQYPAEVQAQAHAQMLLRQQAHMRAQAEKQLQSEIMPRGEGNNDNTGGGFTSGSTPGKNTKTRTVEKQQNIKPAAPSVVSMSPDRSGTRSRTSAPVVPLMNAFQSRTPHPPLDNPSSNPNQMSPLKKNNQLPEPTGPNQVPSSTAPLMSTQQPSNGNNSSFSNNNVFGRSGAGDSGCEPNAVNSEMVTGKGSVGSRSVTGLGPASRRSNNSAMLSSAPPPNCGIGGDNAEAKDNSIPNSRSEYSSRPGERVFGNDTSPVENQSRSFGRAFSSALFPASTLAGFDNAGSNNTPGSDLSVDPYSKNGTSALAALLGVILPPVDSQGSLAASYRLPLEQLQQNNTPVQSSPQPYSEMHR